MNIILFASLFAMEYCDSCLFCLRVTNSIYYQAALHLDLLDFCYVSYFNSLNYVLCQFKTWMMLAYVMSLHMLGSKN